MTGEVNETRPNVPVSAARRARRVAVLGFVRDRGVTTQTELCTALDINPATAMRIIGDLIAEGFVEHVGFVKSAGGRPRARLRFVGTRHAIIGVEASGAGFTGAVTDLDGLIQTEMSATAAKTGPENLALLVQLIADLMAVARPEGQTIVGIGVGVPSIVKKPEGEVVLTLGLDWHELPLQEILSRHFGLHVIVENDRNLAAKAYPLGSGLPTSCVGEGLPSLCVPVMFHHARTLVIRSSHVAPRLRGTLPRRRGVRPVSGGTALA